MDSRFFLSYGLFLAMQAMAQVALKLGSTGGVPLRSRRWWLGFVAANAVGAPSILFLKQLYQAMPASPNVVVVLVMAGTFILTQLVFVMVFGSRPTLRQWLGVATIAIGALLASIGGT